MVYYIDAGNPTSPMRVYNPNLVQIQPANIIKVGMAAPPVLRACDPSWVQVATDVSQLVWAWGPSTANMFKHWFDIEDRWQSTLDNLLSMHRIEMYQTCGAYNTPGESNGLLS